MQISKQNDGVWICLLNADVEAHASNPPPPPTLENIFATNNLLKSREPQNGSIDGTMNVKRLS